MKEETRGEIDFLGKWEYIYDMSSVFNILSMRFPKECIHKHCVYRSERQKRGLSESCIYEQKFKPQKQ